MTSKAHEGSNLDTLAIAVLEDRNQVSHQTTHYTTMTVI
jgi:hypothetical protein